MSGIKRCDLTSVGTDITSKEGRDLCWKARDEYHACLDANEENNALCKDKFRVYETVCTPTWVSNHFYQLDLKHLIIEMVMTLLHPNS